MTDDMAMKIMADPEVQSAMAHGPLKVVVQPVENRMTAEVLPRGPAEAFTARVRMLLARYAPDKFIWVMNRDAYYRLRSRELEGVDLGAGEEVREILERRGLHRRRAGHDPAPQARDLVLTVH